MKSYKIDFQSGATSYQAVEAVPEVVPDIRDGFPGRPLDEHFTAVFVVVGYSWLPWLPMVLELSCSLWFPMNSSGGRYARSEHFEIFLGHGAHGVRDVWECCCAVRRACFGI